MHSRLKVPLKIEEHSYCPISKRSDLANLLRVTKVLIIDEMSIGHRYVFECIDRTLRDIRDTPNELFGGMIVIMAGDWTQILPVIRHGSKADVISSTLKHSYIYRASEKISFSVNHRAENDPEYAEFLKSVIVGQNLDEDSRITLPPFILFSNIDHDNDLHSLCRWVFDNIQHNTDPEWLASRSIICLINDLVKEINLHVMKQLPGPMHYLLSADRVDENQHLYPTEFSNSITASGLPPHILELKIGSPIMLIRNLDTVNGHCNGTKYIIKDIKPHVISASIANGPRQNQHIFIPRIPLIPSESYFPFHMTRLQFPIKPSFGITSNRSQGQTLSKVGVYLAEKEFFTHGQLNVCLSRVQTRSNIKVLRPKESTKTVNIVYKEIL